MTHTQPLLTLCISSTQQRFEAFELVIEQPQVRLGRASHCDVQIPVGVISSHHLTIRWHQGRFEVADAASTNGTLHNQQRLSPNLFVPLAQADVLSILDIQIVIKLTTQHQVQGPDEDSFTLAESATLVRQLVAQTLKKSDQNQDHAYFEVVKGKRRGERFVLNDAPDSIYLGSAPSSLIPLPAALPDHFVRLTRVQDGFTLALLHEPQNRAQVVMLNQEPLTTQGPEQHLKTRDQLKFQGMLLTFNDPLEDFLLELDEVPTPNQPEPQPTQQSPTIDPDLEPATPTAETLAPAPERDILNQEFKGSTPTTPETSSMPTSGVARPEDAETTKKPKKKGWSAFELMLLAGILVIVAGVVGLLLVLFGMV